MIGWILMKTIRCIQVAGICSIHATEFYTYILVTDADEVKFDCRFASSTKGYTQYLLKTASLLSFASFFPKQKSAALLFFKHSAVPVFFLDNSQL